MSNGNGIFENLDLENIPKCEVIPNGEYELRIVSGEPYVSKNSGKNFCRLLFEVPSEPDADLIFMYLGLPDPEDSTRDRNRKLTRISEFLKCFHLSQESESNEWIGKTGWAMIKQEPDQNGEIRNVIARFMASGDGIPSKSSSPASSDDIPF